MRSRRRRDGLFIVLAGLLGLGAAAATLPEPPVHLMRVAAAEGPAAVTGAGTQLRTAAHPRRIPAVMRSDAAPSPRPGSSV